MVSPRHHHVRGQSVRVQYGNVVRAIRMPNADFVVADLLQVALQCFPLPPHCKLRHLELVDAPVGEARHRGEDDEYTVRALVINQPSPTWYQRPDSDPQPLVLRLRAGVRVPPNKRRKGTRPSLIEVGMQSGEGLRGFYAVPDGM